MFCASFRVGITTLTEALPGAMAGTEVAPDDWIDIDKCLTHLASLHGFMFDQRDTTPQNATHQDYYGGLSGHLPSNSAASTLPYVGAYGLHKQEALVTAT